jgi:hypothetical protein
MTIVVATGGAIESFGTLTVRHSTFTNGYGSVEAGAILSLGTATIESCTFDGNAGDGGGNGAGAICNADTMTAANGVFAHNTSFSDWGGAILNGGTLAVTATVFFQNSGGAGGAGGAIWNAGCP